MLNKIIELSLKNRFAVLLLTVITMVLGSYMLSEMDVDVFPDLSAPTVSVLTEAHGMATQEVERLVSYPIESIMNGAPGVRRIRSASSRGLSIVWVEFEWGTDIYQARQIVSEKLNIVQDKLPNHIESPIMAPVSSLMGEVMLMSLSSDSLSAMELRSLADWTIQQRLLAEGGISQVTVLGGAYKQYQILASQEKMRYHNVTFHELEKAAKEANVNASGGVITEYGNQYIIRGEGKTTEIEELKESLIKKVHGIPIKLKDVAEIKIGEATRVGMGSFNGRESIILTILKQPNANTLKLTKKIDNVLVDIRKQVPESVEINAHIFRQSDFIEASVNNLKKTLYEGIFFVTIVLFIFLMNWRTTIISLTAIPISLLLTMIVLKMLGFTINTMSLGGIAIAIGALVDDAIIDIENIYKQLRINVLKPKELRKPVLQVVLEASQEIRNSILIATLIIIVSFLPLFLLTGMEGRLLQPLGISFMVALVISLLVAVTVTPVLSSFLLGDEKRLLNQKKGSFTERYIGQYYKKALKLVLKVPVFIVLATFLLFGSSVYVLSGLGRSFLPEFNEGALVINAVCAPGISLEESNKTGKMVETILLAMDEISVVSRKTGRAEKDEHSQGINSSEVDAPFKLKAGQSQDDFLSNLREKLSIVPGVSITIGQPIAHRIDHMLSGTRANIAIKIFGTDLNQLFSLGNKVKSSISAIDGLEDVNVEQQIEVPQIRIKPKRTMLAQYGLTVAELMHFIDVSIGGSSVSQIFEGQKNFDLFLRYEMNDRSSIEEIRNLEVDTDDGHKIPLHFLAEVKITGSPFTVNKENVQRKVVVAANVSGRDLRGAVEEIQSKIKENIQLPEDYRIDYGGQFESEEKASKLLLWTSIAVVFIIFTLLFLEFKDFKLALVVLINLPLALIGGIFIVKLSSGIISIASTIGFISLFGIATRNGILLISHYQAMQAAGHQLMDTVINGALDRLNPILITAITTSLALIPLAIAGNETGNEIQSPMAIVILGGMLSATILNIFVIPALFYLLHRRQDTAS